MKIGLITFHRSPSYGACLQTFATVRFLQDRNYGIEVIDYNKGSEYKKIYSICFKEGNRALGYATSFIKNVFFGKRRALLNAFGNLNDLYPRSSVQYSNREALSSAVYDVLIVGSDQVWNKKITNGVDEVYLLQFGSADKRISVSSSMGSCELNDSDKEIFRKALSTFSSISVREEFSRRQLMPLTDKDIKLLMDPTFLLTKEEWTSSLVSRSKYAGIKDKYILTFFIHPGDDCRERIGAYAKSMKLPVWSVQMTTPNRFGADKKILGATVPDFLALLANAELVITDSFHGVALSLNLGKNFVAFTNRDNPVRVQHLLEKLQIENRIDMPASKYEPVDYNQVNQLLLPLAQDSRQWVTEQIERKNNE